MIRLFSRSKTYLILFESLVFLLGAALKYDGKPLYVSFIVWIVLGFFVYTGVSAYAVRLNGKLLSLLMVNQMPGEFIKVYSPLLKTPRLKANVLFRMQSYMVTAYIAAGSFKKAEEMLGNMVILPGKVGDQCRGIIAAGRCSVKIWQNDLAEAQAQYDIIRSLGINSGVSNQDSEVLRIRIAMGKGSMTQQDADILSAAQQTARLPLMKNELRLWLGQCLYLLGQKGMGYPYLKDVCACPEELCITAEAKKFLAEQA